jgi:hypothetical protein
MTGRRKVLFPLIALAGACCLLTVVAAAGYFFVLRPGAEARPVVLINTPTHNEQVEVGQPTTFHAVARDEGKITRVELWVDGELRETKTSNLPSGTSPFPLVVRWEPPSPGTHTLIARAFNAEGARSHASVNVEAIERADRDEDGVTDDEDACPDEAGVLAGAGCPAASEGDRDGDGYFDHADLCPDEAGPSHAGGCPDADSDGTPDSADACPSEPGWPEQDGCPLPGDVDADGIPDSEDACPETWGLPEHAGCPDSDGDGTPDAEDPCPDEPGPPEHDGCPDSDGDGIPDWWDVCDSEPGPGETIGCPEGGEDSDGDGVSDDWDACDDEPGLPEHGGCPPPGEAEDTDGDGVSDDEEMSPSLAERFYLGPLQGLLPQPEPVPKILTSVQVQAREFAVSGDFDEVWCYVTLDDMDEQRVPETGSFGPAPGENRWDIAEYLGGRHTVFTWDTEWPLSVDVWCRAEVGGEPISLGHLPPHEGHPFEEWTGTDITRQSIEGQDGHWFEVTYRICAPFCIGAEDVPPPPRMTISHGRDDLLLWMWHGDEESLVYFNLYVNGSRVISLLPGFFRDGVGIWSARAYAPPCGETYEFEMTAVGRYLLESERSNSITWVGEPCPRTARVNFYSIETAYLGDDEWWVDDGKAGPISGYFWVSTGGPQQRLEFRGNDPGSWAWEHSAGYFLGHNQTYRIHDIFEQLWTWIHGHMSSNYRAPSYNYVEVELDPGDDLIFGGQIWDSDDSSASDTLFEGEHTLHADEIDEHIPGYIVLEDERIDLTVILDAIGPGW